MRMLLVANFFPPTHTAGTENYTYGIARGLIRAGHEVQVLCAGCWEVGQGYWNGYRDETYNGVSVRRLQLNWMKAHDPNRYLYDNPVVAAYLRDYLNQIQPDMVHIISCYTLSASVIRTARERGLPVVVTLTDYWFVCPRLTLLRSDSELCDGRTTVWECLRCMLWDAKIYCVPTRMLPQSIVACLLSWMSRHPRLTRWRGLRGMAMDMGHRKRFLRETLVLADEVIVPSSSLKDIFLQNDFRIPMRVLPYGHDLSWLQSYAGKKPSERIRIGYMGQIIPIKGVHLLTQAFKEAVVAGANATLSIFGDLDRSPSYAQQLRRMVSDHANVRFEGAFARESLSDVLAQIDVLVVPSLWYENNPLVIQEAFATKTPVIAAKLGGMSEFVEHETNGLLFERGNVNDLARQLRRAIIQPGLLERLRDGIPPVKTIDQEMAELTRIYSDVIERKQRVCI